MKSIGPVEFAYRHVYDAQRKNSIKRKIVFDISYEDWLAWWRKELGPRWFRKRGRTRGQYVMARVGDCGPYKIGNIRCIKGDLNRSEIRLHKPKNWNRNNKITEEAAFDIKYSKTSGRILAARYGINETTVRDIRKLRSWRHV